MDKVTRITSRTIVMPQTDIDTDQIMPARYLTTTNKEGLGEAAFADWRYDKHGKPIPDFPLNQPGASECRVLVAGNNFGCGSSREHAPWGLVDFGIRAVISTRIADIFRNNSLKNGLVPVIVDEDVYANLLENAGAEVTVDVEGRTLTLPGGDEVEFPLDGFSRHCLMEGIDQLGYLLSKADAIARYEQERTWQP
jgi:3-isopropylmalate/(R)-2-methylmalate dehydratase small subunit